MKSPTQHICKCGNVRIVKRPSENCGKCRAIKGGQPKKVIKMYINGENIEITTKHPLYMLRHHIIERCYTSKKDAKYYKGIKVDENWQDNPQSFYEWALNNGWKKGLTIDRKDSRGNYEPNNCQFITASENTRKAKQKINAQIASLIKKQLACNKRMVDISRELNVGYGTVKAIKYKRLWIDIKEV